MLSSLKLIGVVTILSTYGSRWTIPDVEAVTCDLTFGAIGGTPGVTTVASTTGIAATFGWYAATDLVLCNTGCVGSVDLYAGIAGGQFDGTTAQFDNAMNRWINGILDMTILGGSDRGGSQGVLGSVVNGINSMNDLLRLALPNGPGFTVAVDAPDSGLIYGLRKVLALFDLYYPRNFSFAVLGGTPIRTTAIANGWGIDINTNQNVTVHISSLGTSTASAQRSLVATVDQYIAPLQSTCTHVSQASMGNPTKVTKLKALLATQILALRFQANPANQKWLTTTGGTSLTAYNLFFDPVNGQVTANNDNVLDRQSMLNAAYIRQQFGGFDLSGALSDTPNVDLAPYFIPGPGNMIDYTIQQAGLAIAQSIQAVTVNVPANLLAQEFSSANPVVIQGVIATLNSYLTGGCVSANTTAVFVSITPSTTAARLSDFTWIAATSTLTFAATGDARSYSVLFHVFENCNSTAVATITQTYKLFAPPVFTSCVNGQTIEATSSAGAIATFSTPTAVDSISEASVPVTCVPASGSTFPIAAHQAQTMIVTCSAVDSLGGRATVSFSVTVQDTTAPVIPSLADSAETVTASGTYGVDVSYHTPTATDAVDGEVSLICTPVSGSLFPVGTTAVSCTAVDAHGNYASASFNVVVLPPSYPGSASGPTNNLIVDGGFAAANVPELGWQIFQPGITGWTDITGCGVEIQSNVAGAPFAGSISGSQFTGISLQEMDSECSAQVKQTLFGLSVGQYQISFAYSGRPGVNDNGVSVFFVPSGVAVTPSSQLGGGTPNAALYVNGQQNYHSTVLGVNTNPGSQTNWQVYSQIINVPVTGDYDLWFWNTNISDGIGGFIDDVVFQAVQ